jgi:hypothetical protein
LTKYFQYKFCREEKEEFVKKKLEVYH